MSECNESCTYTREDLLSLANELSQHHWGIPYTGDIIIHNRNWKRQNASFRRGIEDKCKLWFEFSEVRNAQRTNDQVKGTLLHELVHWYLYIHNEPFHDNDERFVQEAVRVGAPISETKIAQKAYENYLKEVAGDE
ncbi:hypothetical protein DH09_08345 [Bacillaceae bacterium JMAK1]|nr:hypothetical protein DH09_08345 [Bacillaceae bacterium JMAK1]